MSHGGSGRGGDGSWTYVWHRRRQGQGGGHKQGNGGHGKWYKPQLPYMVCLQCGKWVHTHLNHTNCKGCGAFWPGKEPAAQQANKSEEVADGEKVGSEDHVRKAAVDAVRLMFGGIELSESLKKELEEQAVREHQKKNEAHSKPITAKIKQATSEAEQSQRAYIKQERLLEKHKNSRKRLLEELAKADENIASTTVSRDEALVDQNEKMAALCRLREQQKQEEQVQDQKEGEAEDEDMCEGGAKLTGGGGSTERPLGATAPAVDATGAGTCQADNTNLDEIDAQIGALQALRERALEKAKGADADASRGRSARSRSPRHAVTTAGMSQAMADVKGAAKGAAEAVAAGTGR